MDTSLLTLRCDNCESVEYERGAAERADRFFPPLPLAFPSSGDSSSSSSSSSSSL